MAVQAGAAIRVQDVKQLLETAEQLLQHTEQLAQMGLAAKQFVSDNQGATEKTVALIKQMMAH
jgi:3-deoxy-D-manno-octulosonic-acid transferase